MPTMIQHRNTRIVTLDPGEAVDLHCRPGDIALVPEGEQWWVQFVDEDGGITHYDQAFENHNKALWTAKAAAEFDAE